MSAKINHGLYRFATGRWTDAGIADGTGGSRVDGKGPQQEEEEEGGDKKSSAVVFFSQRRGRQREHARGGARYTCGLLDSGRFEFISSAAKPLSMRVGLAVPGPGVVITPGQEGRR